MPSKPLVMLAGLICFGALIAVPAAFADQVFHTSHAAVHAVAGAPLQSGFVRSITSTVLNRTRPTRCSSYFTKTRVVQDRRSRLRPRC